MGGESARQVGEWGSGDWTQRSEGKPLFCPLHFQSSVEGLTQPCSEGGSPPGPRRLA